jgi:hypothetical protein
MIYRIRGTENVAEYRRPPSDGIFRIPIVFPFTGEVRIEIIDSNNTKTITPSLYFNLTLTKGDIFKFTLAPIPIAKQPEKVFCY